MRFFSCVQVLLVLAACLLGWASPVPGDPEGPVFLVREKPDFPIADRLQEDEKIKTHVIGKMDDLEATTWISSLSELNFTFPPDVVKSLELEDFTDSP